MAENKSVDTIVCQSKDLMHALFDLYALRKELVLNDVIPSLKKYYSITDDEGKDLIDVWLSNKEPLTMQFYNHAWTTTKIIETRLLSHEVIRDKI